MSNSIKAWNDFVTGEIKRIGTYRFRYGEKYVLIEKGRNNDFEAWFEGEDDEVSIGETPHEAFSDL